MNIGLLGYAAALGLAAIGSAFGMGAAGQAAIGAWKKCYASNKPAPFMLVAFVGMPLTQTIYGFILMDEYLSRETRREIEALGVTILDPHSSSYKAKFPLDINVLERVKLGKTSWWRVRGATKNR